MKTVAEAGAGATLHVIDPHDTEEVQGFDATHLLPILAHIHGVARTEPSYGQFSPLGHRALVIFAHPLSNTAAVLGREIRQGDVVSTMNRLHAGRWVTVSTRLASELDLSVGAPFLLPTPTGPVQFRVAATTTNLGWPGGALLMSPSDFRSLWTMHGVSSIDISVSHRAEVSRVQREVLAALGPYSGLEVIRSDTWANRFYAEVGEGLEQLGQITFMLIIAAVLAMVAAVTAMIWQRRKALSGLRLSGVTPRRLRTILLLEASLLLGSGCVLGVLAGFYGQAIVDTYLRDYAGFPLTFFGDATRTLEIAFGVVVAVFVLAIVPGVSVSRVSPAVALVDD